MPAWRETVEGSSEPVLRPRAREIRIVTDREMIYAGNSMLGSWDQPRVRGPLNRFSGSMRSWLGRFSSVVHFIVWVTVVAYIVQLALVALRWQL